MASESILSLMKLIPESSRAPLRLFLGRELPLPIRASTWQLFLADKMARTAYVEARNAQVTSTISGSDLKITDRCQALLKEHYMRGAWYTTDRLMAMKAVLSYYHTILNERAQGFVQIPEEAFWLVIPLVGVYEEERGLERIVEGLEALMGKQLEQLDYSAAAGSRPVDPTGKEHATVPREWIQSIAVSLEELDEELDHFIRGLPAHEGDAKGTTFAPVDSARLVAALGKRVVQVGMSGELTVPRLRERLVTASDGGEGDAGGAGGGRSIAAEGSSTTAKTRRRPSPRWRRRHHHHRGLRRLAQ